MRPASRVTSPQPRITIPASETDSKARPQPLAARPTQWTLGNVSFFIPPRVEDDATPTRDGNIENTLWQVGKQPRLFNIESTPRQDGGMIVTCTPLPKRGTRNPARIKLYLDPQHYLAQAETYEPDGSHGPARNAGWTLTMVSRFAVPASASLPAAPAARPAGRGAAPDPAWARSIRIPEEKAGRPLSSPTSPGRPFQKRRVGDHGGAPSSRESHNCVAQFHSAIPAEWSETLRNAALSIGYFETQSDRRCLQHAYNNLMGDRLFELDSDLATKGADLSLVCSENHGAPQPLESLVLDYQQLRALIPVLGKHLSGMIVFRGDLEDGEGHYHTLRNIDGHVFLLDSLRPAPEWIQDPELYFSELLQSTGKLVGAMPPNDAPVLERYVNFLGSQARQDIARGLEDVYGTQPIVQLEAYCRLQGTELANAAQLAAYLQTQHVAAIADDWVFDDAQPLRNIDATLGAEAAANGRQRALLLTRTHPYLIPAFLDTEQGIWQARVLNARGSDMETRPLQSILNAQQNDYERRMQAQADNPGRQNDIALQGRSLGAVWLQDWPLSNVSATVANAGVAGSEAESRSESAFLNKAAETPFPWEPGKTYSVKGTVSLRLRAATSSNRWRSLELTSKKFTVSTASLRKISMACDDVPGEYIGEGVFIHRNVMLGNGESSERVYRKIDANGAVLDIGIPIAGAENAKNLVSHKQALKGKGAKASTDTDKIIEINNERMIVNRMLGPTIVPYPLAGLKRSVVEDDPTGIVPAALLAAMNSPAVDSLVDAFAGTGYFTLWAAAQQRRGNAKAGLRLVMNEWDQYRHNTLRAIQNYPDQVKQALAEHKQRIMYVYYRVFHALPVHINVGGKEIRETDAALANRVALRSGQSPDEMSSAELMELLKETVDAWMKRTEFDKETNLAFSRELKSYILDSIVYPLPAAPASPTAEDIALFAGNAAIYLLAQYNNRIPDMPVNFGRANPTARNAHPSGLTMGVNSVTTNRMLENLHALLGPKSQKTETTSNTSRLRIEPIDAKTADQQNSFFSLPSRIDHVRIALTGVEIRQEDGWTVLDSLRAGSLAILDPTYWDNRKISRRSRMYTSASVSEITKEGFLARVDAHAMPAWGRNVRMVVFNRVDSEMTQAMQSRGFTVESLTRLRNASGTSDGLKEMMAINFAVDADATLLPLNPPRLYSAPAAPLAMPGEASSEDDADANADADIVP